MILCSLYVVGASRFHSLSRATERRLTEFRFIERENHREKGFNEETERLDTNLIPLTND